MLLASHPELNRRHIWSWNIECSPSWMVQIGLEDKIISFSLAVYTFTSLWQPAQGLLGWSPFGHWLSFSGGDILSLLSWTDDPELGYWADIFFFLLTLWNYPNDPASCRPQPWNTCPTWDLQVAAWDLGIRTLDANPDGEMCIQCVLRYFYSTCLCGDVFVHILHVEMVIWYMTLSNVGDYDLCACACTCGHSECSLFVCVCEIWTSAFQSDITSSFLCWTGWSD